MSAAFDCEQRWLPLDCAPRDGTRVIGQSPRRNRYLMRWVDGAWVCTTLRGKPIAGTPDRWKPEERTR